MGCKHNYQYTQGHFRCSKCGKRSEEKKYKKNHNKAYGSLAIVGIAVLVIVLINQNYNISVDEQQVKDMIPVDSIEKTMDEISDNIPFDSIEKSVGRVSDSIPVKIEPKPSTQKLEMTQTEIDALRADWMKNRFNDKYRNMEMNCPDHPMKPGHLVFGGDNVILDAIFERCILP